MKARVQGWLTFVTLAILAVFQEDHEVASTADFAQEAQQRDFGPWSAKSVWV